MAHGFVNGTRVYEWHPYTRRNGRMNGVVQLSIIKRMRMSSINKRIGIAGKSLYNKGRKKKEKKSREVRHKRRI
jgi:hypothetical protein